jgi:hydrogenase expression/formation protein HypC
MCYAIPGRVVAIEGKMATVEYFGERRKAHLVDSSVEPGDYVYAQGGIIVSKVPEEDALAILETWKEQFFALKKVDAGLSAERAVLPESVLSPIIKKAESAGTLSRNEMLAVLGAEGDDLELLYSSSNHIRKERLDNATIASIAASAAATES